MSLTTELVETKRRLAIVEEELTQLKADLERRVKRLELFAGDVSRDAWQRAKKDADSGGESKVVAGPGLPVLPVRTELNGIGADKNLR